MKAQHTQAYKILYQKNAAFFNARPTAKQILLFSNSALTTVFFAAYAILLIVAFVKDYKPWEIMRLILAPVLCLFFVTVLRGAINRPRPYAVDGAGITPLKPKLENENKSFPSRHLASAFVIATMFIPYLPALAAILYICGLALGYTRFSCGWHYPTDLLAGAVLGGGFGAAALLFL